MSEKTLFSKIIDGEIPCYKVYEDSENFAFLDINPLSAGHTLCVPKLPADYLFDLPPERLASLTLFAQKVAKGLKSAQGCQRVGVAVLGFDVPHAHIHLVPLNDEATLNFRNPRVKLTERQMADIAAAIAKDIEANN